MSPTNKAKPLREDASSPQFVFSPLPHPRSLLAELRHTQSSFVRDRHQWQGLRCVATAMMCNNVNNNSKSGAVERTDQQQQRAGTESREFSKKKRRGKVLGYSKFNSPEPLLQFTARHTLFSTFVNLLNLLLGALEPGPVYPSCSKQGDHPHEGRQWPGSLGEILLFVLKLVSCVSCCSEMYATKRVFDFDL